MKLQVLNGLFSIKAVIATSSGGPQCFVLKLNAMIDAYEFEVPRYFFLNHAKPAKICNEEKSIFDKLEYSTTKKMKM